MAKGARILDVKRRLGRRQEPGHLDSPDFQQRPQTIYAVRIPSSRARLSTSTRAKVLPELPPGPALWRSCIGSGRGQNLDELLGSGLRKVKPFPLERHQFLQVADALRCDCQFRPAVRFGLLRHSWQGRVCRKEYKDSVDLTLPDPLHFELSLSDPSVEDGQRHV